MDSFEWDEQKSKDNLQKHHVCFVDAQEAFFDKNRVIFKDIKHSLTEERFYCLGIVNKKVMTVRFTLRNAKIRIIGAAYWRKGNKIYEQENK